MLANARRDNGLGRPGKTLVMFALLLPLLLGIVGLVIDCGLLMTARREAQNAADAAALAAAMADLSGQGSPREAATLGVTRSGVLSGAALSRFAHPPESGPHSGDGRYYELVATVPIVT